MWKITIYHGTFGLLLLFFGSVFKRGLIGLVKPKGIDIPTFIWPKIDIYYSIVFILLAIINALVVLFMSEGQWVNFKLFVPFPSLIIFTVIVSLFVSKDIINYEQQNA
jgi:intracellular septation protein A